MVRVLVASFILSLLAQDKPAADPIEWTFSTNAMPPEDGSFPALLEIEKGFATKPVPKDILLVAVVRDEKAWAALWKSTYNPKKDDEAPKIDFKKDLVFYARTTKSYHGSVSVKYALGMDQVEGIDVESKHCPNQCKVGHASFTVRQMAIPSKPTLIFRSGKEKVLFELAHRK